jgi:four helix bundle protein
MGPDSVRTLRIWQEGMAVVKDSYIVTKSWNHRGLTAQVRRAAVSIPANLAEGKGRGTTAEIARFSRIALGSLYELDTLLQIAGELNLGVGDEINQLRVRVANLAPQISAYVREKRR